MAQTKPKLTDALIFLVVKITARTNKTLVPANIKQAKEVYPHAFEEENTKILTDSWETIND